MGYNVGKLAKIYVNEIVILYGVPISIVPNRGTQFTSTFWEKIQAKLGSKLDLSKTFHLQTDGQSEWKYLMIYPGLV